MVYQWNGRSCIASIAARRLVILFLILMHIGGFASLTLGSVLSIVPNSAFMAPLTDPDTHRVGKRMDLESCLGQFDVHRNTIIRTGESQAIGGKYLQGLELETLDECQRLCCETETCDVFIFENKNYAYCYLFDCGPPENFHCKFTRHANYTSAVLTLVRHNTDITTLPPAPPNAVISNISQQEWELASLKAKPEVRAGGSLEDLVPASSLPTMQVVAELENGSLAKAVSTTHVCGRFQFTCHSGECIAVYNACDGIPQCQDGSDEGPECSGAPASTSNAESIGLQPILLQQQLQSMQQRPLQGVLLAPTQINNREDAAAWANRKIVSDSAQMRLGSSNQLIGLEFNRKFDPLQPTFPNANGHIAGPRDPMYANAPVPSSKNAAPYFTQANNLFAASPQQFPPAVASPSITWPQPQSLPQQQLIASPVSSAIAVQLQPQGKLQLSHQRLATQYHTNSITIPSQPITDISKTTVKPFEVPKGSSTKVPYMIDIKNSRGTEIIKSPVSLSHEKKSVNEYDDYVDSSTELPKKKQLKHKTVKAKIIEKEYFEEKKQISSAPSPMHEQYKMIHDNLAVEFRDHEGLSTRPGGAILSLTLGLLVTAALAIIIGCRMRTVGRRVRRAGGKTPYSHEADFLVNGMYL